MLGSALAQRNVQVHRNLHPRGDDLGATFLWVTRKTACSTAQLGVNWRARANKAGTTESTSGTTWPRRDRTLFAQNLLNDEGHILANDGRIAEVNVGMRGYYLGSKAA